jgi:uncharacterized protein YjiK
MINVNKNHTSLPFLNFLTIVIALLFLSINCRPKAKLYKSPPGYDFSKMMEHTELDMKLKEISGLAWDPTLNQFLAIHDERGDLFILDKETKLIRQAFDFGKKRDFEDIAVVNSIPYVLVSDGTIIKIAAAVSAPLNSVRSR